MQVSLEDQTIPVNSGYFYSNPLLANSAEPNQCHRMLHLIRFSTVCKLFSYFSLGISVCVCVCVCVCVLGGGGGCYGPFLYFSSIE